MTSTDTATEAPATLASPAPPDGGYWAEIAFFGHNAHSGYVVETTTHGDRAVYRIYLPEYLWAGDPDAWVEYAAEALFSRRPASMEEIRGDWQADRDRKAAWAAYQAGGQMPGSRALEAAPVPDPADAAFGEPEF